MERAQGFATAHWRALGTNVVLRVANPDGLARARTVVEGELDAIDCACSRFRCDSDLSQVNARAGGRAMRVAPLLVEALAVALRAAELTDGDVDPTVGAALVLAGYDRDWRLVDNLQAGPLPPADPAARELREPPAVRAQERRAVRAQERPVVHARLHSGWRAVEVDHARNTIRLPPGIALDLGATAKAWVADRASIAAACASDCGVLVAVGGDIATAGPSPAGGWPIHVADDHRATVDAPGQTITIRSGGLATSSTTVRRWRRGAATMHHIIDPSTGLPTAGRWRTVSVAAASCVDANIASTAALVRGDRAATWLEQCGLPARLVACSGSVLRVGAWPAEAPDGGGLEVAA